MKQKDSKITVKQKDEGNYANMPKCDIIFSDLDYFLNCYWVDSEPIVNSKPIWVNPLQKASYTIEQYPL